MKRCVNTLSALLLALMLLLSGCAGGGTTARGGHTATQSAAAGSAEETPAVDSEDMQDAAEGDGQDAAETEADTAETGDTAFSLAAVPAYSGEAYVAVNGNQPYFTQADYTTEVFETYSELDALGRCGVAYANLCVELMPTESRTSISSVIPSGWVNNSYDFVDGGWLYNRCHLIGFQLAGENANERNLITGTRYLNVQGMLPFENMVADYIKETENHVLYRVTPVYEGDNLVASGVLMEGWSVEDEGDGICFCVYVYNVQPGVNIDYATGENWLSEDAGEETDTADADDTTVSGEETEYVLNTRSMKFHLPTCSGVSSMSESNKAGYTGTREALIEQGYSPCGSCNP